MTVYELNNDQLNELKEVYILDEIDCPSYEDLLDSHSLPNKLIYSRYKDYNFTEADFFS